MKTFRPASKSRHKMCCGMKVFNFVIDLPFRHRMNYFPWPSFRLFFYKDVIKYCVYMLYLLLRFQMRLLFSLFVDRVKKQTQKKTTTKKKIHRFFLFCIFFLSRRALLNRPPTHAHTLHYTWHTVPNTITGIKDETYFSSS